MLAIHSNRYESLIKLVVVLILSCVSQTLKASDGGEIITFKGNTIEFSDKPTIDTIYIEDPITGEITMQLTKLVPAPIKLNGEAIYPYHELKRNTDKGITKPPGVTLTVLKTYLLTNMDGFISELPDGTYHLNMDHIIIDKEGRIVYYKVGNLQYRKPHTYKFEKVGNDLSELFSRNAEKVLSESPKYDAAYYESKPSNSLLSRGFSFRFTVKNSKLEEI